MSGVHKTKSEPDKRVRILNGMSNDGNIDTISRLPPLKPCRLHFCLTGCISDLMVSNTEGVALFADLA